MRTTQILEFQEALKRCTLVFAVEIACDGERSIESLWDTKAAAEMCRDEHNNMRGNGRGYYGKARVISMPVKTEAMARDLYAK